MATLTYVIRYVYPLYRIQSGFIDICIVSSPSTHLVDFIYTMAIYVYIFMYMNIGKDITWFHSAYLPSMLMATMDNDALHTLSSLHPTPSSSSSTIPPLHPTTIPLPQHLLTHSHWLADGKKMSKSLGNVVSPTVLAKFGSDNVRYVRVI